MHKRSKGDRHFARREKAARLGTHLPSEDDLLMGMDFCGNDIHRDLREYAGRLLGKLNRKPDPRAGLLTSALKEAAVSQDVATLEAIMAGVDAFVASRDKADRLAGTLGHCRVRCHLYLAHLGVASACSIVAGETATYAHRRNGLDEEGRLTLLSRSLGWASLAAAILRIEATGHAFRGNAEVEVEFSAAQFRELMVEATEPVWADIASVAKTSTPADAAPATINAGSVGPADAGSAARVVVVPRLGNAVGKIGKEVEREFKGVLGVALPLPSVPDLDEARRKLATDFPWAVSVVDAMLGDLVGRPSVRFRPTVFVGPRAAGKRHSRRRSPPRPACPLTSSRAAR